MPPGGWANRQETKYLLQHLINGQGDQRDANRNGILLKAKNMADNNIQSVNDGNFEAEVLTASGAHGARAACYCRSGSGAKKPKACYNI